MNIAVGLELNYNDRTLLQSIKRLKVWMNPKQITLVNVNSKSSIPKEILEKFPQMEENLNIELFQEKVNEINQETLKDPLVQLKCLDGDVVSELTKFSSNKNVDFLIIGKRNNHYQQSINYNKLVRKADSNILMIPDNYPLMLNKVLIPIDFSEYSIESTNFCIDLVKNKYSHLIFQHVYTVPQSYNKTGKSFVEFAKIMKQNAEKEFETFKSKIKDLDQVSYEVTYTLNQTNEHYKEIMSEARKQNTNLIILSNKGHSALGSLMLGSTAESLLNHEQEIPVMLIKQKNKKISWIDELNSNH